MRWLTYLILAYLVIGLQTGLVGFVRYDAASPNLVMLVAVFIALNAPRDAALLGCFCLGTMQDLVTQHPLGIYALSYGLIGMFVLSTQEIVYREHPLTHFSLGLVGGLMTAGVIGLHGLIHPDTPAVVEQIGNTVVQTAALRTPPLTLFTSALFTAVVAPFVLGPLQKGKKLFAFQPKRVRPRAY